MRFGFEWLTEQETPSFISLINPKWEVIRSYRDYGEIQGICITFPKRFRWRMWRKEILK